MSSCMTILTGKFNKIFLLKLSHKNSWVMLMHFQGETVHFFFKNKTLRSESINLQCYIIIIIIKQNQNTFRLHWSLKTNDFVEVFSLQIFGSSPPLIAYTQWYNCEFTFISSCWWIYSSCDYYFTLFNPFMPGDLNIVHMVKVVMM